MSALGWVLGGAAAIGALVLIGTYAEPAEDSDDGDGPAKHRKKYYVALYNYPSGHRDRRLKAWNGPFTSRQDAKHDADREKDVWYPVIMTRKPF